MESDIRIEFDNLWRKVSEIDKSMAVTCHEVCDVKTSIQNLQKEIGKLEGKYDEIIKMKIQLLKDSSARSLNIKMWAVGITVTIIAALIRFVPDWLT